MRKLIIGIAVVLVLLIAAIVLAVVNLNGFLEENRPRLAGMASEAAGREVDFERASVAFSGGLAVRLDGLRVAEDPRFGDTDFMRLDSAYVGVDLLPALRGEVSVSGIELRAPMIRVVQTAEGFNFDSLGGAAAEGTAPPEATDTESSEPLALAIAALEIVEGTIVYHDRSSPDGLALTIEALESSGTDLSLTGPIAIDFSGLVRPTEGNAALTTRLEGRAEVDSLDPLEARVRLESPSFFPGLVGLVFEEGETLEHVDGVDLRVGLPADVASQGYPITLETGTARLAGFDLDRIDLNIRYRGDTLEIEHARVGLADGEVEVKGDITFGEPGASPFDLKTLLRDLDTGELAAVLLDVPRGAITGTLGGDIELAGDSLEWESLKQTLIGKIRLDLGEGALERVNVLDDLVGRLVTDPGLGSLTASSIRDVAPSALSGDRTPFDGAKVALQIIDGALRADEMTLDAGDFSIAAIGELGFDGGLAGEGSIRFSESLSQDILAKADALAPLLGKGDRVELPLRFSGEAASPVVRPDLAALTANARESAKQELQQRATKELSEALFGKKKKGEGEQGEAGDDEDAARDLLDKGLKGLFGR